MNEEFNKITKTAIATVAFTLLAIIVGYGIGKLVTSFINPPKTELSTIYNKVRLQTVALLEPVGQKGGGTGSVVQLGNGERYTLTNAHVCKMTKLPYVVAKGNGVNVRLNVIAIAQETDLCILQPVPGMKGLQLAEYALMYDQVYVVGHPLLNPISIVTGFFNNRDGIDVIEGSAEDCSGPNRRVEEVQAFFSTLSVCVFHVDAMWSDAKILPGNSGSPVVNYAGQVVGVAFAGSEGGFSYVIPLDVVKKFLLGMDKKSLN